MTHTVTTQTCLPSQSSNDSLNHSDSHHTHQTTGLEDAQPLLVFRAQSSAIVVDVVNPSHFEGNLRFEDNAAFVQLFGFATAIILLGLIQCRIVEIDEDIATWVWGVYITFVLHVIGGTMEINSKRTSGIDWIIFVCGANWMNTSIMGFLLEIDVISRSGRFSHVIPYVYVLLLVVDIVFAVWGFYAACVNDVISELVDGSVLWFKREDTSATFIVGTAWLLSGYASMTIALDLEHVREVYGLVDVQCRYLLSFSVWLLFSSFRRNHYMDVVLFVLTFFGFFAWLVSALDASRQPKWEYTSSVSYIIAGVIAFCWGCKICHDNSLTREHPVQWFSMVGAASYMGLGGYFIWSIILA